MSNRSIVISYLTKQKKWMVLSSVNIMIFVFVFYVYNLPLEPILYAGSICILVTLSVISLEMVRYHKKVKQLTRLHQTISYELAGMPEPTDLVEEQYHAIITRIYQNTQEDKILTQQQRREVMEYYTMWVHQIKTPLAAIRLLLQLDDTSKRTELLSEVFKVEQYVDMALQYLRIDDISSDLVLKEFNLEDIVKQAIRKHASWFISKNITINLSNIACLVLSDEKWLSFVLEQLISNALKYTSQGGAISIYLDQMQPNTLVIEDNGIGIAMEDLPRIFEKGFTGHNGRIDRKATGIGLYLVKRILSKLSHAIEITSVISKGTKVHLCFHREYFVIE